ncbi:MAG TPA: HupE/UreJ family protein [Hyphomicrobiales bacterium]|nr:HupE/UreJ family protein [Hyphomicrobiales bacterium]
MRRALFHSLLCFTLALCALPAQAHTLSESLSSWFIQGNLVQVQFTVPELEAKRLSASGNDVPPAREVGQYLTERLRVNADGEPCAMTQTAQALTALGGFQRFELAFECPTATGIVLQSDVFYDLVPTHTNFAQVEHDGRFSEHLLTDDSRELALDGEGGEGDLASAGLLKYLEMGIMHIFTGIDHMSFMLGLVLISRKVRDLLIVITGFTIGHSFTLALAVTGILRPDGQYIDALVAFTIAMIGAENIGDSTHRPFWVALVMGGILLLMAAARELGLGILGVTLPTLLLIGAALFGSSYLMLTGYARDAARIRLVMTLVFGLIHGFGFASNLLELQLPKEKLAQLLVGFNLGVEIGQVTVVLVAIGVARLLSKMHLAMPRPLFTDLAAGFLVAEGFYWFISRSMVWG